MTLPGTEKLATPDADPRLRLPRIPGRMVAFVLLIAVTGGLCVVSVLSGWIDPKTIQHTIAGFGAAAVVAYIVAVILMELFWLPRMWGLFAGGVLFGPWLGGALSLVADFVAALLCYQIARGAGQDWVSQVLSKRPKAQRVVELLAQKKGTLMVAVLRVCPVAHYTLVSFAAGLSGVPRRAFALGTAIGIVPGAVLYPLVGDAALSPTSPTFIVGVGLILVALVLTILATRKILEQPPAPDGPVPDDGVMRVDRGNAQVTETRTSR